MKPVHWIWAGILLFLIAFEANAQSARSWTAHTSAREVTDLSAGQGMVWVASTGGIFGYIPNTGQIIQYTAAEGLHNVNVQAIAWDDERQLVWIGYADGVFDRLDITSGEVTSYFDIYRSERYPSKVINTMEISGDSLLIATGFGLVVFDPLRNEVRDTYSRFGSITPATAVNDVIVNALPDGRPGLWVGTDAGVSYAPLSEKSLQDPTSWTSEENIFPSSKVTGIVYHHGRLYIGTPFGLGRQRPDGAFERVGSSTRAVLDLGVLEDRVLAVTQFRLRAYNEQGDESILVSGYEDLRSLAISGSDDVWLGDAQSGLNHYMKSSGAGSLSLVSNELYPEGPFHTLFGDLSTGSDGSLWAAAQLGVPRSGFYRMDPEGNWTNFTGRFIELLSDRGSFWRVHVDGQGSAWAGSRGAGLAHVSSEDAVTIYNQSNSTLLPAAGTQNYIIVGGIGSEEDGTLWVTNTISPYPLHVRTPDGNWNRLLPPQCAGASQTNALGNIFVDSNGIKWIILLESGNLNITRGLLILDTNETPEDSSDDLCTYYSMPGSNGTGLPGSDINSITEDLSGRIWVGTSGGPAYFRASLFAANDPATEAVWPVWRDRELGTYVLRGLGVNDIAVDPSNRLWMATSDGVYLLSENDGYSIVAHYKADNSPLFSDEVTTITVEETSGRVFLGTDKGLISLLSDAIQPAERTRDLFVYPNPVEITSNQDPQIYIEGLVAETEISVTAVHGELIRRMQARGGRGLWDGRDQDGRLVPSGMYLIVARGKNGEEIAYGKVAIIH
ncbi:MAG: regulator [Bacteroidetes bacterium]|nr:regulator [Bacteroidota bacterium]